MSSYKNYVTLITTTYGITNSSAGSTKLRSAPLDFLRTGLYDYLDGDLRNQNLGGTWWSDTGNSDIYGRYISTSPSGVIPQNNYYRGAGFAIRCVTREG